MQFDNQSKFDSQESSNEIPLIDDLGVEDLRKLIYGKHGRLFSAAGRESPVAELAQDALILHPPQTPFTELGPTENITIAVNSNGILLDELGEPRKISAAKYQGSQIYWLGEHKPDTYKHYAGFLRDGQPHKLYYEGEAVTTDAVYKARSRTINGDISSIFSETPEVENQTES